STFSVVPDGTPLFFYQTFANDVAIANATNRVYTIASAPATANGAKFKVKITNAANSVTSADATLTVSTDTTPPTIVKVTGSVNFMTATVVFSERVTAVYSGPVEAYCISR